MRLHYLILLVVLALPFSSLTAEAVDKKPIPADLEPLPEALPPPAGVIEANPADEPEITIVKKGETTLLKAVNDKLDAMEKNGDAANIFKKWLGDDSPYKAPREFKIAPIQG